LVNKKAFIKPNFFINTNSKIVEASSQNLLVISISNYRFYLIFSIFNKLRKPNFILTSIKIIFSSYTNIILEKLLKNSSI